MQCRKQYRNKQQRLKFLKYQKCEEIQLTSASALAPVSVHVLSLMFTVCKKKQLKLLIIIVTI